jgi:tetratricopeptide (TPR) repeat protein
LQPSLVYSQSASELLEKGIYAEETKGDIEGAISIYQKLVDESKANETLAAQAQFRLGLCLHKKKRVNEAMAAFEKLIRDLPNEK